MKTSTSFAAIEARSTYHGSCKRYFTGSRPDLNIPYREVSLSTTRHSDRVGQNAPVPLYDTSGPYTDPDAQIDLTRGLQPLRTAWIEDRLHSVGLGDRPWVILQVPCRGISINFFGMMVARDGVEPPTPAFSEFK
jgi:hypothetical protein